MGFLKGTRKNDNLLFHRDPKINPNQCSVQLLSTLQVLNYSMRMLKQGHLLDPPMWSRHSWWLRSGRLRMSMYLQREAMLKGSV